MRRGFCDKAAELGVLRSPPGVDAVGTGFPSSAVEKVEDACWQRVWRHLPAAERLPPKDQGSGHYNFYVRKFQFIV